MHANGKHVIMPHFGDPDRKRGSYVSHCYSIYHHIPLPSHHELNRIDPGGTLEKKTRILWGRVILAAFLSEVGVIAALMAVIGVHRLAAPGRTAAEYQQFSDLAGYYVAPAAAGLAAFAAALWAVRRLTSDFIANGTL